MENNKKKDSYVTPSPRKRHKISEPSTIDKSRLFFESPEETICNGTRKVFYKCRECGKIVNGTKTSNLTSHIEHVHSEIFYEKIKLINKEALAVKRIRILLNATEIVTVNGRPFNLLLDSGYKAGIERKLQKLKEAGIGIDFSNPELKQIKQYIHDIAEKVRKKIEFEVKNKMLSILVDITTRNGRSIFGISVQFIVEKKVIVRSLGLIELTKSHTGIYLSRILLQQLKKFGIEKRQIICITTDNGKNVVKMVRDFNEINDDLSAVHNTTNLACRSLIHEFLGNLDENNIDDEIERVLANEMTEEDALEELFHEQEMLANTQLLEDASNDFVVDSGIHDISGVNCIAHTIQLLIKDALKSLTKQHRNVIELARGVAKFLRKQTTIHEMNEKGFKFKMPRIDCSTRWGSTCIMVCSFKNNIIPKIFEYKTSFGNIIHFK